MLRFPFKLAQHIKDKEVVTMWTWLFWQHADAPDMAKSNTQAINYPYPITNTPPLTTHHALIVCKVVHGVCPCDNDRDAKDNDCDSDVLTSDQFSRKLLWNATILVLRRQKPSTNALDGLYLLCGSYARGLLGWKLWWVIVEAYRRLTEKSLGASLHLRWCRFSPHGEAVLHRMSLPGGGNPQSLTPTLCSSDHFTLGWFTC